VLVLQAGISTLSLFNESMAGSGIVLTGCRGAKFAARDGLPAVRDASQISRSDNHRNTQAISLLHRGSKRWKPGSIWRSGSAFQANRSMTGCGRFASIRM